MAAQWTGTLYNVGFCSSGDILTVNSGQGHSNVLGPASFVFMYCINGVTPGSGWGIVTTANGDKLYERITNVIVIPGAAGAPTTWSEDEELLGGTGRFENAFGDSKSSGIWTSADGFPVGVEDLSPMLLAVPPDTGVQNWIGTTTGKITF